MAKFQKNKAIPSAAKSFEASGILSKHYNKILYSLVTGAAFFYIGLNPHYQVGFLNDDAVYVIAAKDFWKTAIKHPLLGIKPDYPFPGLPLVMAPFARLVSPHWVIFEWLSMAVTILTMLIIAKLARKWLSAGEALVAVSLYAFNPVIGKFSGIIMPSIYFSLASLLSFYLLEKLLDKPAAWMALGLGFIVGWGSVFRPESVILSMTVIGILMFSRKGRGLLGWVAIPLAGWISFIWIWFQTRQTFHSEFGGDIQALLTYWPHHMREAIPFSFQLIEVFLFNTVILYRSFPSLVGSSLNLYFAGLVLVSVGIGFYSLWREKIIRPVILMGIGVFCGLYFLIHVFWHVAAPRYFIPILPYATVFLVRGGRRILGIFSGHIIWTRLVLSVLILIILYGSGYALYRSLWTPNPLNAPPFRSLQWLHDHSDPRDRVTSNIPSSVDLYADRPALGVIATNNGDEFLYLLAKQRLDYIVFRDVTSLSPGVGTTEDPNILFAWYKRWVTYYPQRFPCVFSDSEEKTSVYKIITKPGFISAYETYIVASKEADAGRYLQAYQKVNETLALDPKLGCATNLMGALHFLSNRLKEAENAFLKAKQFAPDSINVRLNLAVVYHQQGQTVLASDYLKQAEDLSKATDNQMQFNAYYQQLQDLWKQGRTTLFFAAPNTRLYDQIIQ